MSKFKQGDIVRVVLEGPISYICHEYANIGDDYSSTYYLNGRQDHVKWIEVIKSPPKVGEFVRESDLESLPVGTVLQNGPSAGASDNLVKLQGGEWLWLDSGKSYPSSHLISGVPRKILFLP